MLHNFYCCAITIIMDSLLDPLEELENKEELTEEKINQLISIPSPEYVMKKNSLIKGSSTSAVGTQKMTKYEKEYDEFCHWSAIPKAERKPKTVDEWERQHTIPHGYTKFFKKREDYRDKRLTYFWEWMMDVFPEVVYNVYKRALVSSPKDAAMFIDLIAKRMNLDKPRQQIQPMIIMGVAAEKIDALFTPKNYENVKELVPEKEVKK